MPSGSLGKMALKYHDSSFSSRSAALILLWRLPGVKVTSPPPPPITNAPVRNDRSLTCTSYPLLLQKRPVPHIKSKESLDLSSQPRRQGTWHMSARVTVSYRNISLLLRLSMWPEPWTGWRCSVPLTPPSRGCTLVLPGVTRAQCPRVREPSRPTSWGPVLSGR